MLDARPIALSFGPGAGGPWTPIAAGLENTGSYRWRLDNRVPDRIYLRLEVRDEAGNVGTFETAEPVSLDRHRPEGRIRGVRPCGTAGLGAARDVHRRHVTHFQAKAVPVKSLVGFDVLGAGLLATTSAGSSGGGLFLSQPVVSSQSRTNCLSNDGCGPPGRVMVGGQKRELSGVSTSSIKISSSSTRPHSNFVSAMMMPRLTGMFGAAPIDVQAAAAQLVGHVAPHQVDHLLERNIDVVAAILPWWRA